MERHANRRTGCTRLTGLVLTGLLCGISAGCGTSTWSDTRRTATEQLLISDAMDRAVSKLDFRALAGRKVFLDNDAIKEAVDHEYLTSSIRQHMLASGCILKDEDTEADYIVELRVGAVGTDRHDVLYGVPAVNVPTLLPLSGVPSTIPEIPLAKKTDQRAVVKLAVFAYNRETGRPVWQSGVVPVESEAKDFWFFGAGPFQRGTIYNGTNFAGDKLKIPLIDLDKKEGDLAEPVPVADEAYFVEPEKGRAEGKKSAGGDAPRSQVKPVQAETPRTPPPPTKTQAVAPAPLPSNHRFDNPPRAVFPHRRAETPEMAIPFPSIRLRPDGDFEASPLAVR